MKIYQLFLSLILIVVSQSAKLNYAENQKRLKDCGKQMPPVSTKNEANMPLPKNQWLAIIGLVDTTTKKIHSDRVLGTFISPRHILTSSQAVMDDDEQWIWNRKKPEEKDYVKGTKHVKVPGDSIDKTQYRFRVMWNSKELVATNAWVLRYGQHDDFKEMRTLMIVELEEDQNVLFPCLVQETETLKQGDQVSIYGVNTDKELNYRKMEVGGFSDDARWILLNHFYHSNDRGGPMVSLKNNQPTVIGVSASVPVDWAALGKSSANTYFFDVRSSSEDICFLSGVCDPLAIPPPTSTETLIVVPGPKSTQSTPNPTTPRLTDSPVSPPETTRKPNFRSRSTRKPDEDYTDPDYDKIEGGENEDEEEEDDFLVSADFLNGSGKMGLNFVLFAAVLAMVLSF